MGRVKQRPSSPEKADPINIPEADPYRGNPKDPDPLDPAGAIVEGESADAAVPHPAPYKVGYGKPPLHTRFQPGRGGKGRQKGQKGLRTIVRAALNQKVTVQTNTGPLRLSKLEALVQSQLHQALKGEPRAVEQIIRLVRDAGLDDEADQIAGSMQTLDAEDTAILARYSGAAETDGRTDNAD